MVGDSPNAKRTGDIITMGKNRSDKAKAKKEKLKQERASTAASLAVIKAAYAVSDPLDELFAFKSFRRNGLDIVISFHKMTSMTEEDTKWAFELLKVNMKTHYVRGGMGWKDREKWDELTHDNSCFLVAREKGTTRPVAYVSYRYDIDEGDEVVYCYEIQLEPEVRRKGLGKFLMQILELMGHRAQMKKIVLTVFKENEASIQFFRKCLNYEEDHSSPSLQDPLIADEYSYYILSKSLTRTK